MGQFAFGELELAILKIVKELEQATVHDVQRKLDKDRSYNTVMTVMSRLAEKGELLREKKGKQYIYWIGCQQMHSSKNLLRRIQDKIFKGKSCAMVSYLLEINQKVSDEELKEIEDMIREKREKIK